jgi:hypothetical protein
MAFRNTLFKAFFPYRAGSTGEGKPMNTAETQVVAAAVPELVAALQAFSQFETDVGTDPTQWPVRFPAAKLKFLGTVGLQLQPLIGAEVTAGEGIINSTTAGWIAKLQSLAASATAPKTA